jgi:hypothetical protein
MLELTAGARFARRRGLPHVGPGYHAALAVKDERCALAAETAVVDP